MKIKLYEILNMQKPFADLSETKVPSRIQYWIMRNTRLVKEHVNFWTAEQFKLMKLHLFQSDDGSWGKMSDDGVIKLNYKSPDDECDYNTSIENLTNMDVEIDPYFLDYEKVIEENPSFILEAKYLNALETLIK